MVASRGRRGLHKALVNFELLGLGGGGEPVLQGDEDGRGFLALEPLIGLHRRLRPDGVRVQVLLEEVGLRRPQRGAGELQPSGGESASELRVVSSLYLARHRHHDGLTLPVQELVEPGRKERFLYILLVQKQTDDSSCSITPRTEPNLNMAIKLMMAPPGKTKKVSKLSSGAFSNSATKHQGAPPGGTFMCGSHNRLWLSNGERQI